MKRWDVMIYHYNGEAYKPEMHSFYNEQLAKAVFTAIKTIDDIVQVDLYEVDEVTIESGKLIGRKDKT